MNAPRARAALLLAALAAGACSRDGGSPPPPRPAAPPTPVVRATAEAPEWEVALEAPAQVKAGERTLARVSIVARGKFHVSADYPTAFLPADDGTVKVDGARVAIAAEWKPCGASGSTHCTGTGTFPFTAPAPGPARLAGAVAFSVCDPDRCLILKPVLALALEAR